MLQKILLTCACCLLAVGLVMAAAPDAERAQPEAAEPEVSPADSLDRAEVVDEPSACQPAVAQPALLPNDQPHGDVQLAACCWNCAGDCDLLYQLCVSDCASQGFPQGCFGDCRADRKLCLSWCEVVNPPAV